MRQLQVQLRCTHSNRLNANTVSSKIGSHFILWCWAFSSWLISCIYFTTCGPGLAILVGGPALAILDHYWHGPWVSPLSSKVITLHWWTMSKGINLVQNYYLYESHSEKIVTSHSIYIWRLYATYAFTRRVTCPQKNIDHHHFCFLVYLSGQ